MRISKSNKLLALLLAALMLMGSVVPAVAADDDTATTLALNDAPVAGTTEDGTLVEINHEFSLISYESYKSKYGYSEELRTGESVTVAGADFDPELSSDGVEVTTYEGRECVISKDVDNISWKINVPESGFYCVKFDYCAYSERTTDIERIFKINGKAPFAEARYQKMPKTWNFDYQGEQNDRDNVFQKDTLGNELRPASLLCKEWSTHIVRDSDGYYPIPLEFWLEQGENTITLEGAREDVAISGVTVYTYTPVRSYEEVKAEYEKNGYEAADAEPIILEAETPDAVSNYTIYPVYDRSSAITSPQDASLIYRNTIGADKWITSGQWIRYTFTPEASGLYEIGVRFSQNTLKGMASSRSIRINGEYPFEEAKNCQFPYDNDWQNAVLNDGNTDFSFYFEAGKEYTIEFEVALGNLSDIVREVDNAIDSLNDDYMDILELAGSEPDEYRDYGFARIMPEVIQDLAMQSELLFNVIDYITEMNGVKSENTSTLQETALVIEKMASNESEIARNLSGMKEQISSLGTWLSDITSQYLEVDYISIIPQGSDPGQGEANFWQSLWFEILKFFASFFTDYNSIGAVNADEGTKSIVAWTASGRDQAQIIKNLINDNFTRESDINVALKLVAPGTLLPAILAGTGPDVSLDAMNPIDYAIRGAIVQLNDFPTFDEVMARFADSAKVAISIYGKTYAVPVAQSFSVMFARDDVLYELGLKVPETWDDLMSLIPVLQFNNMDIGMSNDATIFLFQNNGQFWKDEGMQTNLNSHLALETFETMCNMFTQYSLPVSYNAGNRFKTGEMPLIISDYAFYNTLVVFAPEITGQWSFYQIPGTRDEKTGEVNHSTVSGISGIILPRGCSDEEATWEFADWFSAKDYQIDYSNEMMALLGPSAKQQVANIEALEELPWSAAEKEVLKKCINDTVAVEPYPGSYYIGRYTGFAFQAAYNKGADPSDELLSYIDSINKELTRKRKEFELMTSDEWAAIAAYCGFDSFDQWKDYWRENQDKDTDRTLTYIQDNQDGADRYTYVDWMEENNITVSGYKDYTNDVKYDGETRSYKEWLES